MNVAKLLEEKAQKYPDKPAIIFKDEPITFQQLKDSSFKLANGLLSLGIKKGDRVALYLSNQPEYIYSYFAAWSIGAVAVPLDFMLTEEELESCLKHCEAKLLIAKTKDGLDFPKLKQRINSLKDIVLCPGEKQGFLSLESILNAAKNNLPAMEIKDNEPAMIMYTSGTTGRPKGILWNYKHLGAAPCAMEYFVDLTDKDVKISCLPLSHSGGLVYIQNMLYFGITLVLLEHFIPLEFLKNIERHKATCFHMVPSMYYAVLQLKEWEKFDLSSLRWVVVFGAPSSAILLRRFHQACPRAHFLNGWGMTETCPPNLVIPLGSDKIESVGRPAPWYEIKIFDGNDNELPQGEVGELVIKGWVVMDGYYKDAELTSQAIKNGWFHTGDLAKADAQGYFYIVGRKKEMIKVGGEIVFEPEVETAIHRHPAISEVAVIAVADKLRGEVPKAFVTLKDGQKLCADDLRYFLRQHLAHFKIPHYFEFRDSLPKNRSGKLDKELLRKGSE